MIVLVETLWVLGSVYDQGPMEIAKAVEILLNHRDLIIQDSDVVAAAASDGDVVV